MNILERDLAEHLRHFGGLVDPDDASPCSNGAVGTYVGAALSGWGFAVERLARPQLDSATALWGVVGRLGHAALGRVQLRARLDQQPAVSPDPGLAGVAVLLALSRFLAQYHLRYSLEVIVHCGPLEDDLPFGECAAVSSLGCAPPLAAVCFEGPGQIAAPNLLSACGVSADLATGARRLLARYPGVAWRECPAPANPCPGCKAPVPGLLIGAGHPVGGLWPDYSQQRLREAAMLGAEIVALLQKQTPSGCRPEGLAA